MKGLIKKDLLMIKSNIKILLILLLIYGVMAYKGQMDLSFILPFMSVMIMISTFSYDTYNKWDAYAITLPDGRKNSIRSKYIATLLLIVITTIVVAVLMTIIGYAHAKTINFNDIFATILGTFLATTILQSFMYPSIYKFGLEKARIGIFVVVFGIAIIGGILSKYINFASLFQKLSFLNNYMIILVPIIIVVMMYISYKVSEAIYKKKEY